jgi:hypothetical protein
MNYQQFWREIELQNEWADERARYKSTDNSEPSDSLGHLLMGDDLENLNG